MDMKRCFWFAVLTAVGVSAGACGKKAEGGADAAAAPVAGKPAERETPVAPGETQAAIAGTGGAVIPESDDPWLSYADGKVHVTDEDGTRALAEGDALLPGAVVTVDPDARAQIDFPDGSTVDLDEMSEMLIQTVEVAGGLRRIELSLLSGAARVTAPATEEAGSVFILSTPVGITEVRGTVFAVNLGVDADVATVVVFDGAVRVQAGEHVQVVSPPPAGPIVVEMRPATPIIFIERPEEPLRWNVWTDRQADTLIVRHGIDIAAPEPVRVAVLDPGAHPLWAVQIGVRRARIAARIAVLAPLVDTGTLAVKPAPKDRFEAASAAWRVRIAPGALVVAEVRNRQAERWAARAEDRRERHVALRARLVENRAAHRAWREKHPGRGRGHAHGHAAPGLPRVVPPPGAVITGPSITVTPPSVEVTAPLLRIPGIRIGPARSGVHEEPSVPPPAINRGGKPRGVAPPPPAIVAPPRPGGAAPPPPAVIGPARPGGAAPPPPAVREQRSKGRGDQR